MKALDDGNFAWDNFDNFDGSFALMMVTFTLDLESMYQKQKLFFLKQAIKTMSRPQN